MWFRGTLGSQVPKEVQETRTGLQVSQHGCNHENEASVYGNLFTVFSVFQSNDWWIDTGANIPVCADISLFSSYQVTGNGSVLMGNGATASVLGVGTVDLKFTSGRIVQHVPAIKKNLVSGSM